MPENAECKVVADQLNDILQNKTIQSVEILGGKYVNKKPNGWDLIDTIIPSVCTGVYNKGKKIFFDLKSKSTQGWFISSLGMTGKWTMTLEKHSHIKLTLSDGGNLYYTDARRFGNFDVIGDISIYNDHRYTKLAPTFVGVDVIDLKQFKDRMKSQNKKLTVTKVLLEQNRVCSGIGMYVLVETLYASKLSPHITVGDLSSTDIENLYNNAFNVINNAYKHKGLSFKDFKDTNDEKGTYSSFLKLYGKKTDITGTKIRKCTINGRNISWVLDTKCHKCQEIKCVDCSEMFHFHDDIYFCYDCYEPKCVNETCQVEKGKFIRCKKCLDLSWDSILENFNEK